jgi:arginine decarboxylase
VTTSGSGLAITVVAASGQGGTPLSAFDAALWQCGVHDYNLIALSSVIPPGARVAAVDRYRPPAAEFGRRLYVVRAEARSAVEGAVVGAGLGWLQWGDGRGVFVEHEGEFVGGSCVDAEAALADQIQASLRDLAAVRSLAFDAERAGCRIAVARVEQQPTSAVVLAVYQSEAWR